VRRAAIGAALAAGIAVAMRPHPGCAQAPDWNSQSFEMTAEPGHATVGDSVTVRFRIRLHERDLLSDSIARPVADLAEGVRLLDLTPLRKVGDRMLEGRAQLAFYRVGHRPIPLFGLPFVRIVSGQRGILVSDSAYVDINSVAPPGNPALRDIKEIDRRRGPDPRLVVALLGLAGLAGVALLLHRRLRGTPPAPKPEPEGPPAVVLGPYEIALARLSQIERERWPARGEVDRHYDGVAHVVRRYLEDAHGIPALERTTGELVWALPPLLADGGLRDRCAAFLADADLVKFARHRPDDADAARLIRAARELLGGWRNSAPPAASLEPADAVR
jgi:hypothetical protein